MWREVAKYSSANLVPRSTYFARIRPWSIRTQALFKRSRSTHDLLAATYKFTLIKFTQILWGDDIDTHLKYLKHIDYNFYFIILCQDFAHSRHCLQSSESIIEMRRGKIIHINFIGVRLLNWKKNALLNIKSKLKAMTLTILWSTYRKHRHFHDETNKYFSIFENTFVESDQLKILQAHVNGKNSGYM